MTDKLNTLDQKSRELFLRYISNAQTYFSDGIYDKAFEEIKKAGAICPESMKLAFLTMEIFKRLKDGVGLIKICNHILEIDKESTDAKLNLAFGYFLNKNYDTAIDILQQLLKRELQNNQEITAKEILADCLYGKNDYEQAKNLYLEILNKVYQPKRILIKLTACYYHLNEPKNVVVMTGRLIELGVTDKPIIRLYNEALKITKKDFEKKYKPQNIFQKLFRQGYDPAYADYLKLEVEKEHTERRLDYVTRQLYTDETTQANSREYFDNILKPLFNQKNILSLIHFDLDNFKKINDTYGHTVGDIVLKEFADIGKKFFTQKFNGVDYQTFCRYGGEEFLAIYFGTKQEALKKADEFREYVKTNLYINVKKIINDDINMITCSGGIAEHPTEANGFQEAYLLADNRLYMSKEAGRNKITAEGGEIKK